MFLDSSSWINFFNNDFWPIIITVKFTEQTNQFTSSLNIKCSNSIADNASLSVKSRAKSVLKVTDLCGESCKEMMNPTIVLSI